jgi:hypothetical protein
MSQFLYNDHVKCYPVALLNNSGKDISFFCYNLFSFLLCCFISYCTLTSAGQASYKTVKTHLTKVVSERPCFPSTKRSIFHAVKSTVRPDAGPPDTDRRMSCPLTQRSVERENHTEKCKQWCAKSILYLTARLHVRLLKF